MKEVMHTRFVPEHYTRDLFNKLTKLPQGTKSVEDYYKEMEIIMMRVHIYEDEEHTIARFLNGLNYPVQKIVEFQPYTTIVKLVHQATKAERQVKKEAVHERAKAYYASRNGPNASSSPAPQVTTTTKQVQSTLSSPSAKATPSTMSSKASTSTKDITFFKCGTKGHKSFECKNTRVMITHESGEIEYLREGEYEALVQASTTIEEEVKEDEALLCHHDASPSLVVTKVLTTQPHSMEDQRCSIFQTRAGINGKSIKVIVDGGSCHNLASMELCTKLKLPLRKHPSPYFVQWLSDDGSVKIHHTVSISFNIGPYEDTVECDVVPMTVCHMLLGRPLQYDKKAMHDGHSNIYSFKVHDKTFILKPMTPSQIIADNAKVLVRAQE